MIETPQKPPFAGSDIESFQDPHPTFRPYPEYQDSSIDWLGDIPAGWRVAQLKHVSRIRYGLGQPPREKSGGIPVVRATNIERGRIHSNNLLLVDPNDVPLGRDERLNADDILVVRSGAYTADSARVGTEFAGSLPGYDMVVSPRSIFSQFLAWYLLSRNALDDQLFLLRSRAAQPHLNTDELGSVLVTLPPLDEQRAIASFLDGVDERITRFVDARRQMIALLGEQKQAIINQAVTKGLDSDVPMKPSGIDWLGDIPAHWKAMPLGYIARIGNGSTPSRTEPKYWADYGFPWLNSANVNQDQVTTSDQFVTDAALTECHLPVVRPGDILMGITGQGRTRGMVTMNAMTATINQHISYIRLTSPNILGNYLLATLQAAYTNIRDISSDSGSTKGAITCEMIRRYRIPVPPLIEQTAIVNFLDSAELKIKDSVSRYQQEISLIKEYRTRIISDVVTGKLDVRCASLRFGSE